MSATQYQFIAVRNAELEPAIELSAQLEAITGGDWWRLCERLLPPLRLAGARQRRFRRT
jgi:hypothetical protein